MSDLPPGWVHLRLADVASTQLGRMLSARRETGAHARPYLRNRDVQWGHISVADLPTMDFRPDDASRFRLASDDVLVCEGGEVGRAAIWKDQLAECYYQKALHRIRTSEALSPAFLRYLLEHYASTRAFAQFTSGSTIAHLPQEDLRNLPVNLPPRAEQERIVTAIEERFSRLDAGDAALKHIKQGLKQMKAVVLESAIAGNSSTPFDRVQFGDLLREPLRNGHSAKADPAGSVRIWSLTAVTDGNFSLQNTKLTSASLKRVRDLWVQPGDLLIERSNTPELVGTARLYDGPPNMAVFPDLVIRARVSGSVLPRFAELVLQAPSSRQYFQRRAQGISGSMPKIDQATIKALSLYLPPVEVQIDLLQSTDRQLSAIDLLEGVLKNASTRSARLRSSILAAAFSGKLVTQDRTDEPIPILLGRIAAERATSNTREPARSRTPRSKVTA